ncbi:uncharacterized protein BO97DRAFT_87393 [Aspergillus homomorphus CBS 101889]|uniref:Acid protease n=1 Tax=Aspergillus homomorphus (strain CBS 101889) TaxID=1450537 RepID=A0A395HV95_ASPHC|nr:hypothetical protein BO97DRAFT_87393 [Aspergillus homomorphus CBS 101889]RAL11851.1 hypothetical protein BO97DRAFT_87393 [Aspergillus homomorphus CBS 101889]
MANKLPLSLLTVFGLGFLASAQLAVDTTPVTAAAPVETVSMIDASGLPITTVSDAGDNAWYVPLTGPASVATAAWGASVHLNRGAAEILPITFGTTATPTRKTRVATSTSLPKATVSPLGSPSRNEETTSTLEIPLTTEENALLLGADTTLTIESTVIATAENPTNISTTNLTSLPVGMNLGFAPFWAGALVFGGNYDSSRIFNESHWQTTAETSAGNCTFIQTGTQALSGVQLRLYGTPSASATTNTNTSYPFDTTQIISTTTTLPATLNFTSETLTVPDATLCDRNFSVIFNPTSGTYPIFEIPVWADLVPAGARCVVGTGEEVVLGRPFFQAAYVYITDIGDLYFASIRRDDMAVVPREFDLHAVLGVTGGVDAYGNGTVGNGTGEGARKGAASGAGRVVGGFGWGAVVGVLMGLLL